MNKVKEFLSAEFIGSVFGLVGAFLIALDIKEAFFVFLVTNVMFIKMGFEKKLRYFTILQFAFLTSTIIGITRNFL